MRIDQTRYDFQQSSVNQTNSDWLQRLGTLGPARAAAGLRIFAKTLSTHDVLRLLDGVEHRNLDLDPLHDLKAREGTEHPTTWTVVLAGSDPATQPQRRTIQVPLAGSSIPLMPVKRRAWRFTGEVNHCKLGFKVVSDPQHFEALDELLADSGGGPENGYLILYAIDGQRLREVKGPPTFANTFTDAELPRELDYLLVPALRLPGASTTAGGIYLGQVVRGLELEDDESNESNED